MNWFLLALICAFLTACCDALSKRLMRDNDEWMTGTIILGIAGIVWLPIFLAQDLRPVTPELILLLAVALPLETLAYYLFLSAIRIAPLSLTVPLLAFTPVLTILTSWVLLGENINLTSGMGIGLVTLGAYVLNAHLIDGHVLAPLRALVSNSGSRRMLMVAVIWAFTSSLGKKGTLLCGAMQFGCILLYGHIIIFSLVTFYRVRIGTARTGFPLGNNLLFLIAGIFMAGAEITHFLSISMAPVCYMISVKRLSLLFGVILGWIFFGEQNIRYRLAGATAMVAGVIFISC
jgi:drug/metabolite transporter (DMT)-like permease